jgi:hypothetical protein
VGAKLLATLTALGSELHHPGTRCSRERIESLLHPDFHEVGRSGRRYDRETVIRFLAEQGGQPEVVATEHAVRVMGEGAALITYRSARRQPDGSLALRARRSSVWLRDSGAWRLLYHQGTPEADAT